MATIKMKNKVPEIAEAVGGLLSPSWSPTREVCRPKPNPYTAGLTKTLHKFLKKAGAGTHLQGLVHVLENRRLFNEKWKINTVVQILAGHILFFDDEGVRRLKHKKADSLGQSDWDICPV